MKSVSLLRYVSHFEPYIIRTARLGLFPTTLSKSSCRPASTFSFPMADRSTLVKPPPLDPSKSAIENVLELTELKVIGPVCFSLYLPRECVMLKLFLAGHLHEYPSVVASPRGSRNLRRRSHRTMSLCRAENGPWQLHSTQHALLFCACGGF